MEMLPGGLMVTSLEAVVWVLTVVAGAALLLSARTPRLGSRLGWVYPAAMAIASVVVLVVDAAWWLTRSDPRAAAVAGVAGLWLWLSARERVRVLESRRDDLVAVARKRVRDARARV
jgi:Na+/melibiose symporter-like transporter